MPCHAEQRWTSIRLARFIAQAQPLSGQLKEAYRVTAQTRSQVSPAAAGSLRAEARADSFRRSRTAYLFLLPYLLIFCLFLLLPAIAGFGVSFTDWRILGDPHWIGLDNFRSMFDDK